MSINKTLLSTETKLMRKHVFCKFLSHKFLYHFYDYTYEKGESLLPQKSKAIKFGHKLKIIYLIK